MNNPKITKIIAGHKSNKSCVNIEKFDQITEYG